MKGLNYLLVISFFLLVATMSSCSETEVETNENYEVVEFPDGSRAFLNHQSIITFDKEFKQRTVKLNGEAYFDIKKGDNPFTVITELAEITVLGTEFNVKSDKEEIDLEVEQGTVNLKTKESEKNVGRGKSANCRRGNSEIKIGQAKFKFKVWLKDLEIEWEKLEKDIDTKQLGKDIEKVGRGVKKELKRI